MKRLTKTNIEYADLNWNFYPGCRHQETGVCPVSACWAKRIAKRQGWDFSQPRLIPDLLLAPLSIRKPSRILVNFMGDLGGEWVNPEIEVNPSDAGPIPVGKTLREVVLDVVRARPEHAFLFLTKKPAAWQKWNPWPDNAWVGASVCNFDMLASAADWMPGIKAKHKWLSIEPLLTDLGRGLEVPFKAMGVDWLAIGGQTRPNLMPKIEWVKEIVQAAGRVGIPVWLKDNLWDLLTDNDFTLEGSRDHDLFFAEMSQLRQELPVSSRDSEGERG